MVTTEQAEELIEYYKENVISADFENEDEVQFLQIVVKDDADIEKCAEGCQYTWESTGEYPNDFKGLLRSQDGSKTATFDYVGTSSEFADDLTFDDYDFTLDKFEEFWADDVAKKFNENKEVEFTVLEGVDDLSKMGKFIIQFVNEKTRLGADIVINLIHPDGKKLNLWIPANKENKLS